MKRMMFLCLLLAGCGLRERGDSELTPTPKLEIEEPVLEAYRFTRNFTSFTLSVICIHGVRYVYSYEGCPTVQLQRDGTPALCKVKE